MEAWKTILLAFGGNAALIAVLGFIGKSLIEKLIVRDTKLFESDLKAKTDAEIERFKNELAKNIESYRVQLKKSEFLFQKEFEAASAFSALLQSLHPGFNNPMMDSYEAHDAIASDFGKIEIKLSGFLANFGAVLTDEERKALTDSISDAGYGKFDVMGEDISVETNELAGKLYNNLQDLETKMIKRVRDQSSL